ncbi:MAG: tRNA (N(6)-L-threonylcarbamoyladenosine(37)-C(2))-methylthiotransferase MtaB [Thermodesulfovibrionales bacterium]|nr:tRNA (N(6)-L-threonylcarbamoyladenosine(37)-C(2))-methylthiotransferase MtaB [Thermodesulfovibrionales bacterium]
MNFKILTLGCKTNQAESAEIEKKLCQAGHQRVIDSSDKIDVCIINTCSVTSKADQQSRNLINRYIKENIKIIVTGCYSVLNYEYLKKNLPNIEIVKNDRKLDIINFLKDGDIKEVVPLSYRTSKKRPAVKIQEGCNNACSYCIVPQTRGKSKSKDPNLILEEIKELELLGYKEIVLTGTHIGAYGMDLIPKLTLSDIIKKILSNTSNVRIRLSSIEITDIGDELLDVLSNKRVCKHFHIPLQSGDNKILNLMNRKYSVDNYVSIIEELKKKIKDFSLGTDIITGFPYEGEREFKNTLATIETIPFTYMHIFTYSKRPTTKASQYKVQVSEIIKKERSKILRNVSDKRKEEYIQKNIGNIKEVIVENKTDNGYLSTSDDYLRIVIDKNIKLEEGSLIKVIIKHYQDGIVYGVPTFNS